MPKSGFHGHVEEAYLRFIDKKLKEKRASMGINPLIRDLYLKIESQEAKSGAPISPVLSPFGINVADFVNQFNKLSESSEYGKGAKIPTIVNVFENKSTKFYFSCLFSYYIVSNNNNKYKAFKLKDIYKKYNIVKKNFDYGKARVWSIPHELYSKTETKLIDLFYWSRRKHNKKKMKTKKIKLYSTVKEHRFFYKNDVSLYKTLLATIQGGRVLLYLKLKNFSRSKKIKWFHSFNNSFESFIKDNNQLLLGKKLAYKRRHLKLLLKIEKKYIKWFNHKVYMRLLFFKSIKNNVKKQVLKKIRY